VKGENMSNVIKIESMEQLEKILDKLTEKLPDRAQINIFIMGAVVAGNDSTSIIAGDETRHDC
jgi:hypothetical protein